MILILKVVSIVIECKRTFSNDGVWVKFEAKYEINS